MTLQDFSLVSQTVGVLLVSGALIFVGLQMRQTHAIERGNAQRDILSQTREWWMTCVEDEEFSLLEPGRCPRRRNGGRQARRRDGATTLEVLNYIA